MGKNLARYHYEPGAESISVIDRSRTAWLKGRYVVAETVDVETAQFIVDALNARDQKK